MFNFLKNLLTDIHNQWDFGLIVWQLGCILYLYRGVTAAWDFSAFGLGLAGVLGAGAALQWAQSKTEAEPSRTVTTVDIHQEEHKEHEPMDRPER